jgi:hypothetical protein
VIGSSRSAAALALVACLAWPPACAFGSAAPPAATRPPQARSTTSPTAQPAPPANAAGPRRTTILLLDESGSMRDNDPNQVRCAAARTFIALSRSDEMVGVIGFTSDASLAWSAGPLLATPDGKRQLADRIRCTPNGFTPTLDALLQAKQMLSGVPGQGPGSVVVLTDGVPEPDTAKQIDQIETAVVPIFQARHWRIDTIALGTGGEGTDIQFRFLQQISRDTMGQFTDGSQGRPATAFNLLPAFVSVLKNEAGRSPLPELERQSSGPLEFTVPPSASRLDVVVLCRDQCSQVSLRTPAGAPAGSPQPVAGGPGAPQYGAIFSLDGQLPWVPSEPWRVTVQGGGEVRIESLVDLPLAVEVEPLAPPHQLGQRIAVAARAIEADGSTHLDDRLILNGTIRHSPDGGTVSGGDFALSRGAGGRYTGSVSVPPVEGPGKYELTVTAFTDAPVATRSVGVDVGLFPRPGLPATATATSWPVLGGLYSLPGLDRLAGLALQGPAQPTVSVNGTLVDLAGRPYTKRPMLDADVARPRSAARVGPSATGGFALSFPAPASGSYIVDVHTGGPDSFGETLSTAVPIQVTVVGPSPAQVARAIAVTVALALLLCLLILCVRFPLFPPPRGRLVPEGQQLGQRLGWSRDPVEAFLWPSRSKRRDGLEFRFRRHSIEVRKRPWRRTPWRRANGGELSAEFRPERTLLLGPQRFTVVDDSNDSKGRRRPRR